jgi:hypothetical protein
LPDDFEARTPSERSEILGWVQTNVLAGTTEYRRFQAEAMKEPYALKFSSLDSRARRQTRLEAPARLQQEMQELVEFKSATLTKLGYRRTGTWCEETWSQRVEHLGLMLGALVAPADGPVAGLGIPTGKLTLALLAFPAVWDWYINWRSRRRGFFTVWEADMLQLGLSLARAGTGWLRQSPELAERLRVANPLISDRDVEAARQDWARQCDRF